MLSAHALVVEERHVVFCCLSLVVSLVLMLQVRSVREQSSADVLMFAVGYRSRSEVGSRYMNCLLCSNGK
jgi:hypothetical protein